MIKFYQIKKEKKYMSHSKKTKKDFSLYVEKWNPSAKKFINTCAICNSKGYNPSI